MDWNRKRPTSPSAFLEMIPSIPVRRRYHHLSGFQRKTSLLFIKQRVNRWKLRDCYEMQMRSPGRPPQLQKQTGHPHWQWSPGSKSCHILSQGKVDRQTGCFLWPACFYRPLLTHRAKKSPVPRDALKLQQGHHKTQVPSSARCQGQLEQSENVPPRKILFFCCTRGVNASQSLLAPSAVRSAFTVPPLDKNALNERVLQGPALKKGFAYQVNACTWHGPTFCTKALGYGVIRARFCLLTIRQLFLWYCIGEKKNLTAKIQTRIPWETTELVGWKSFFSFFLLRRHKQMGHWEWWRS